jgi:predicted O-methyltransferase YrrM
LIAIGILSMMLRITKKDVALICGTLSLLIVVSAIGLQVAGEAAWMVALASSFVLSLVVVLELYRRLAFDNQVRYEEIRKVQKNDYCQIESLISLFFTLKPELPFPEMRGWAASPDFLKRLAEVVLHEKPNLVVEASSGVSTLVIAYCLKQTGKGRVVSLEHEAKFALKSQTLLAFHGLADTATIVHAPLLESKINGQQWLWYDTDKLKIDQPIDLLVVDGPPENIQKLSRYPALPLLNDQLRNGSIILMDDGRREDETAIVGLWEKEFRITTEFLDLEKGAYLIRKGG